MILLQNLMHAYMQYIHIYTAYIHTVYTVYTYTYIVHYFRKTSQRPVIPKV